LDELKKVVLRLIEIIVTLSIGLLFTVYILRPIYENFGIQFTGNVWVNWFGVTYILFVLYSLIVGLFISKESILFKQRLTSLLFWLIFIGSNYVVFIPFIKGENPF
jgi:prepilin signal peptidase PulO-like enzyme (type II secretory pathway)